MMSDKCDQERDGQTAIEPSVPSHTIEQTHDQTVILTCHTYESAYQKWQGFRNMGLVPPLWRDTPSLTFYKMLGSGGGDGFSLWPNWGQYYSLTTWDTPEAADQYLKEGSLHPAIKRLRRHQSSEWSLILRPYKAHGAWDHQSPFRVNKRIGRPGKSEPIVILTRARIRARKLMSFWRDVPQVSRSMHGIEGNLLAVGIGELPLIQQATISLWESEAAMRSFAYTGAAHRDVIKRTREMQWYSEELFARFQVIDRRGELPTQAMN